MVLGISTYPTWWYVTLVIELSRALQTGNPDLCGKVPFNLRGIVATFLNESTLEVREVETLGACNGAAARPGTAPEVGPVPSARPGAPEPATNRELASHLGRKRLLDLVPQSLLPAQPRQVTL